MRIPIGAILDNPWATKSNPSKLSIYIGCNKTFYIYKGKVETIKCDRKTIEEFKVVGMSETVKRFKSTVKNELTTFRKDGE